MTQEDVRDKKADQADRQKQEELLLCSLFLLLFAGLMNFDHTAGCTIERNKKSILLMFCPTLSPVSRLYNCH